jgi:predicted TPR repeat methyltransferase
MSSKMKLRGSKRHVPSDADRLTSAIRMHQQGQVEEAAAIYRQVLQRSPNHVDALQFLGVAMHQLGDHDGALAQLGRALALAPDHPDVRNNRGNVFKKLGRLDEAEADYRRALALRPKDANARSNLGTVLRERGQLDEAVATFREVIALVPNHGPAWQNLGNALTGLGRIDEAIEAHREAVRLAPQLPSSYHYLGAVLAANGKLAEAREVFGRWVDLFPDDPRARHMLAACSGESAPDRASDDYVRAEFSGFAASFDAKLASLEYKAPSLIAEQIDRLLGQGEVRNAVLDAGCGTGLCASFLRPRSGKLVGVDLSPEMVELAGQRHLYDALVVEELTAYLRKHEAAFDLVVSADTLVYFGDLGDVIAAAAQAMRADAILIFTVERITAAEAPLGFRIQPSGRYAHSREYITATLSGASLGEVSFCEVSLRKEAGQWVEGFLVSAKRPPAQTS